MADSGPCLSEVAFLHPHLQPSSGNLASSPWIRYSASPTCPRGNFTSGLTSASTDTRLGARRGRSRFLRRRGTWGRFRFLVFPTLSVPSGISYSRVRSLNALAGTTAGRPESECWGLIVWSVGPRADGPRPRGWRHHGDGEEAAARSEGLRSGAAAAPEPGEAGGGAEPHLPQSPRRHRPFCLPSPPGPAGATASALGSNLTVFVREF